MSDYSELLESLEAAPCDDGPCDEPAGAGPVFMSVKEAEGCVDGREGALGGGAYYRLAAQAVLDPANNVLGSATEFFNFINSYLCAGDYFTALKLAQRALALYPYSVDLLSAGLQAATGCARFDVCEGLLDTARAIPQECWNWRLFIFTIGYYQAFLCACEPSRIPEVLEEALGVAHDYQRCLPRDERGYDKEAELLLFANRTQEAQEVLERAIFGKVVLQDGTAVSLIAPQCCVTMLDEVLGESADYDLIARVAQRGVRNTAQAQPSANIAYFVYREALALDAMVCDAADERDGFRNAERVRAALTAYRCAYGMLSGRSSYRSTIERRYSVLCHKGGISDMPLAEGVERQE